MIMIRHFSEKRLNSIDLPKNDKNIVKASGIGLHWKIIKSNP